MDLIEQVFDILGRKQRLTGVCEMYHHLTFRLFRYTESGEVQDVMLEVSDAGPDPKHAQYRYRLAATADNGRRVVGSRCPSIDICVAIFRWHELDFPPENFPPPPKPARRNGRKGKT
ncbi:MAG TPA: hypothetical protein VKD72_33165 [Gemmataceae bacterium]|nr:hypothetical protein [Gemmataceae bacterium]